MDDAGSCTCAASEQLLLSVSFGLPPYHLSFEDRYGGPVVAMVRAVSEAAMILILYDLYSSDRGLSAGVTFYGAVQFWPHGATICLWCSAWLLIWW